MSRSKKLFFWGALALAVSGISSAQSHASTSEPSQIIWQQAQAMELKINALPEDYRFKDSLKQLTDRIKSEPLPQVEEDYSSVFYYAKAYFLARLLAHTVDNLIELEKPRYFPLVRLQFSPKKRLRISQLSELMSMADQMRETVRDREPAAVVGMMQDAIVWYYSFLIEMKLPTRGVGGEETESVVNLGFPFPPGWLYQWAHGPESNLSYLRGEISVAAQIMEDMGLSGLNVDSTPASELIEENSLFLTDLRSIIFKKLKAQSENEENGEVGTASTAPVLKAKTKRDALAASPSRVLGSITDLGERRFVNENIEFLRHIVKKVLDPRGVAKEHEPGYYSIVVDGLWSEILYIYEEFLADVDYKQTAITQDGPVEVQGALRLINLKDEQFRRVRSVKLDLKHQTPKNFRKWILATQEAYREISFNVVTPGLIRGTDPTKTFNGQKREIAVKLAVDHQISGKSLRRHRARKSVAQIVVRALTGSGSNGSEGPPLQQAEFDIDREAGRATSGQRAEITDSIDPATAAKKLSEMYGDAKARAARRESVLEMTKEAQRPPRPSVLGFNFGKKASDETAPQRGTPPVTPLTGESGTIRHIVGSRRKGSSTATVFRRANTGESDGAKGTEPTASKTSSVLF